MKNNPYWKFFGDPGPSPRLGNLGYLSKSLLEKAGGVNTLKNYQILDKESMNVKYKVWIDRVVGLYGDHLSN